MTKFARSQTREKLELLENLFQNFYNLNGKIITIYLTK